MNCSNAYKYLVVWFLQYCILCHSRTNIYNSEHHLKRFHKGFGLVHNPSAFSYQSNSNEKHELLQDINRHTEADALGDVINSCSDYCPVISSNGRNKNNRNSYREDNGGTIVAIAGKDYCVIAADTRLSREYSIQTRNVSRIWKVSEKIAIGAAGCWADIVAFRKELEREISNYKYLTGDEENQISVRSIHRMLSNKLYSHRFSPYYAHNIVAGLDDSGTGVIYAYDSIGSFDRVSITCSGRGQRLMQPILDRYGYGNQELSRVGPLDTNKCHTSFTLDEAKELVQVVFHAGNEREISIGDSVEMFVVTKDGINTTRLHFN